jgi:D-threo-aldose 1-dehydrogenase
MQNGGMSLPLERTSALGQSGVSIPPVVFGTSALGNLYREIPYSTKLDIARSWFQAVSPKVAIDTAGKYGAGLSLQTIGAVLRALGKTPEDIVLSNKLGWRRVPLEHEEPTFEPGVWKGIVHDADQDISYEGIIRCYEQGTSLLGAPYTPALVSVHDPDEYLAAAEDEKDGRRRLDDILDAYRALGDLKSDGKVRAVGVGAKDWRTIRLLSDRIDLDWVMFACSLTVYTHPPEVVRFMDTLASRSVGIINSAVFNAGFLIGGDYFDYRPVSSQHDEELFQWRESFMTTCRRHGVEPAHACIEFGLSAPGVVAVALNTSKPDHILDNASAVDSRCPREFWETLRELELIRRDYERV